MTSTILKYTATFVSQRLVCLAHNLLGLTWGAMVPTPMRKLHITNETEHIELKGLNELP